MRPAFLITIDTEGDRLWSAPKTITTSNAFALPRLQTLAEQCGLRPTWLVNYEMAMCAEFGRFARDVLRRKTAEIGMHLHAWNSPPLIPLTPDDSRFQPYMIEYPDGVMQQKIDYMTSLLEDRFSISVVSHRSGRWAMNSTYARLLAERGYRVDCSVTPYVDWSGKRGAPQGHGGSDYRQYPAQPYFLDLHRIECAGDSQLLEVPVSVMRTRCAAWQAALGRCPSIVRRGVHRVFPPLLWLRPNGKNLRQMLAILSRARAEQWPCVEFMLHSSELMAGQSPTFPTAAAIERLYRDLDALFAEAARWFCGATLSEFYVQYQQRQAKGGTGCLPARLRRAPLTPSANGSVCCASSPRN